MHGWGVAPVNTRIMGTGMNTLFWAATVTDVNINYTVNFNTLRGVSRASINLLSGTPVPGDSGSPIFSTTVHNISTFHGVLAAVTTRTFGANSVVFSPIQWVTGMFNPWISSLS